LRNINLTFKSRARPVGCLIMRMKINAAVGAGLGHHFDLQLKILEGSFIANIIKMRAIAPSNESAVFNFPSRGVLDRWLPTSERFSVHERDEPWLKFGGDQARYE